MNDALLNRAFQLHQSGKVREALDAYSQLLVWQPDNHQLLYLAGTASLQMGQTQKGLDLLNRSLLIKPDNAVANNNIGRALLGMGNLDKALAFFDRALEIKPDYAEALYHRGVVLRDLKRPDEALDSLDKALALNPGFAEGWNDRGMVLQNLARMDEALASYDKALVLNPKHAGVFCNRGIVLRELRRPQEALASYDKALALKPDYAEVYNNRGVVLHECMRLDEALASFDKAIAAKPDYAKAHCNKAYLLLLKGEFDQGWELLEWRFKGITPQFARPHWLGAEPLDGKTILLHADEGLGDTIQFSRYATSVSELGAKVILEVQKPLAGLLKGLEGVTTVIERGQPRPAFDYHCPLQSLPFALRKTVHGIPHPTPYLHADEAKVRDWGIRIGSGPKLKVGIVWSGGLRPDKPEWRVINESRNIPLDVFCQALNTVDAEFFSLQKGDQAEAEMALHQQDYWPRGNFHNLMGDVSDFSDTAAIIANLDVVVTVCTSIAHLSGALGKRTWILSKFDADWRWQVARDDSPWYHSVKLYRQAQDRLWEPVLQCAAADLTRLAARSTKTGA